MELTAAAETFHVRIERPLLKLPIRFCGETLAAEVNALPANYWLEHPQKFEGNAGVPLVSPGGALSNGWAGAMAPTEALYQCPYIMQIMEALDATWGRSRLMSLAPGSIVPEHVDIHYYWRTHLRIHVPVITNAGVAFTCAGETVRMEPGECWILDSFFEHSVENSGNATRVHLVLDTVGSGRLWDLIEAADGGAENMTYVAPAAGERPSLTFEQINAPEIMSPWEIKAHVAYLQSWMDDGAALGPLEPIIDRFLMEWSTLWARFGTAEEGTADYAQARSAVKSALLGAELPRIPLRNGRDFVEAFRRFIIANAIDPARLASEQPARLSA